MIRVILLILLLGFFAVALGPPKLTPLLSKFHDLEDFDIEIFEPSNVTFNTLWAGGRSLRSGKDVPLPHKRFHIDRNKNVRNGNCSAFPHQGRHTLSSKRPELFIFALEDPVKDLEAALDLISAPPLMLECQAILWSRFLWPDSTILLFFGPNAFVDGTGTVTESVRKKLTASRAVRGHSRLAFLHGSSRRGDKGGYFAKRYNKFLERWELTQQWHHTKPKPTLPISALFPRLQMMVFSHGTLFFSVNWEWGRSITPKLNTLHNPNMHNPEIYLKLS